MIVSEVHHVLPVRSSTAMDGKTLSQESLQALAMDASKVAKLGVGLPRVNDLMVQQMMAMDASPIPPVTEPQTGVALQFLQTWLQGIIYIITVARKCDVLAPVMMVGRWSDHEIVQQVLEHLGTVGIYKDHGDVPLTSWNLTYERRSIVRFELGMQVQRLEDDRGNSISVNTAMEKRASIALAFEMLRNDVFFHGYAQGGLKIYGMLNDPNLPNFCEVQAGTGGSTEWAKKTVDEKISDILTALRMLRVQSGANIDPKSTPLILALPVSVVDLFHEVDGKNTFGYTVQKWLSENYPNIRIEAIPQFDKAMGCPANGVAKNAWNTVAVDNPNNGSNAVDGKNIFYLYAESVAGTGTDDGKTMLQLVPSKIQPLNTVMTMKGFDEGYTSALAGCFVKRGYAVVRFFGI